MYNCEFWLDDECLFTRRLSCPPAIGDKWRLQSRLNAVYLVHDVCSYDAPPLGDLDEEPGTDIRTEVILRKQMEREDIERMMDRVARLARRMEE